MAAFALLASPALRADDSVGSSLRAEVRKYLSRYEAGYAARNRAREEARWRVAAGMSGAEDPAAEDPTAGLRSAEHDWDAFVGSIENIELSRTFERRRKQLPLLEQRQLARIVFEAGGSPAIVQDLVEKRVDARLEAAAISRGETFTIDGVVVSRAEVERILREERDLGLRRTAWESLHAIGPKQKPQLVRLRWLENEIVRSMGSSDVFAHRAREYGVGAAEIQRMQDGVLRELRPLQTELHTFLRFELARRFERPVPDLIPAHWLPGVAGAEELVRWLGVGAAPSARAQPFREETPLALVERSEELWQSLGFAPLPASFFEHSLFGPSSATTTFLFADIDRAGDVRAIFDTTPNLRGWIEAQHLVGRAHLALVHVRADVPVHLRMGANRAFHDALSGAVALGATRPRTLQSAGLGEAVPGEDRIAALLVEALSFVLPIAHSGGTLCEFERELYRDEIDPAAWNARWWSAIARYEGIAPPAPRDERWCDPAAEERFFSAPAQGYDEAFAHVIAFELHDHIARKLLDQDPHEVDIHGRREVGDFLKSIARFGATVDWRTKLREKLGYEISARPMVDYFEPLREWLATQNSGRRATLSSL